LKAQVGAYASFKKLASDGIAKKIAQNVAQPSFFLSAFSVEKNILFSQHLYINFSVEKMAENSDFLCIKNCPKKIIAP
jgi:hypothetical protein